MSQKISIAFLVGLVRESYNKYEYIVSILHTIVNKNFLL